MAWPSVGSVEFITLKGPIEPKGAKTGIVSRPGVDGVAVKRRGTRGDTFQLTCVKDVNCANAAALKTKIEACMALEGTTITVVDDHGISWTELHVLRVARPAAVKIETPVGGIEGTNATHLLTVPMVLIDTRN